MPLGTLASASQESHFRGMESEFGDTMFPGGLPQPDQSPDALGGGAFAHAEQESPTATAAMPSVPAPARTTMDHAHDHAGPLGFRTRFLFLAMPAQHPSNF